MVGKATVRHTHEDWMEHPDFTNTNMAHILYNNWQWLFPQLVMFRFQPGTRQSHAEEQMGKATQHGLLPDLCYGHATAA